MIIPKDQIEAIDKIIRQEEELKAAFASAYQGDFIVGEIVKELKHMRADSANSEENDKRAERVDKLMLVLFINTAFKRDLAEILPLLALTLDDEKQ